MARMSSSVSSSIFMTSAEVRKPSKQCRNGTRDSRVARAETSAMSMTSCHRVGEQHCPARRAGGHERRCGRQRSTCAWTASERAAMWNTVLVNSPRSCTCWGSSNSRPWLAVNVVASAPACNAPLNGARGAAFGLHFLDDGHRAPDVFLPFRHPLIGVFAHCG